MPTTERTIRPDQAPAPAAERATAEAVLAELLALLRELHPHARTPPDLRLDARLDRDLGLDSLSRMELLARLEQRFRVRIPEQAGFAAETPSDLVRVLAGATPLGSAPTAAAALELTRGERLEVPASAQSLIEVLRWHAERHPDRLHVHFEGGDADGVELTFGALHEAARRIAAGLQAAGLRPAEPVALMLPTHPDFLTGFLGVMLGGGVPVPLYPPMRASEMAEYWRRQAGILRNCGARLLLGNEDLRAHRHLVRALTGIERLLTVAELALATAAPEPVAATSVDLALLQYTSGSTADPKGVMISHGNVLANLRAMGSVVGVSSADTFVSWLPLYHDMGLIGAWLGCLYYGAPLVLMPPQTFLLRPERWLWAIHRYRATLSAAPNFAYELCLHRVADSALEGLDLGSLRLAFCGAEPVFPETLERFATRFARHGFRRDALYPVYGLAENTLGLAFPPPGRGPRVLHIERDRFLKTGSASPCPPSPGIATLSFVSCGLPLPGHELRIADANDRELPPDQQGRVQFHGPSACTAYYRNPENTRALKHGAWLDSGDLGFLHDGELYLSGRVKDLIIRAGRHLHPQGLEQAVGELPGVRRGRVAVFGSVDGGTERLVVVAETRLTAADDRTALRARVQSAIEALAGEPADAVVLAAPGTVLKTSSGKLRRAACREAYESGRLGARGRQRLLVVLLHGLQADTRSRLRRWGAAAFAGYSWVACALVFPAALAAALLPSLPARWRAVRNVLELLRRMVRIPLTTTLQAPLPERPCVFVANHASYLDTLLLVRTLPRPVAFAAKQELAQRPMLRWLLTRFGAAFVARSDPAHCADVVAEAGRADRDFLFFPEGTFQRMPGLLPFHLGAFAAAARTGMPVVPIVLRGTRAVLQGDEWFPRRGPLAVTIGAAILPQPGADRWAETLRLAAAARAVLLTGSGEPDLDELARAAPPVDQDQPAAPATGA